MSPHASPMPTAVTPRHRATLSTLHDALICAFLTMCRKRLLLTTRRPMSAGGRAHDEQFTHASEACCDRARDHHQACGRLALPHIFLIVRRLCSDVFRTAVACVCRLRVGVALPGPGFKAISMSGADPRERFRVGWCIPPSHSQLRLPARCAPSPLRVVVVKSTFWLSTCVCWVLPVIISNILRLNTWRELIRSWWRVTARRAETRTRKKSKPIDAKRCPRRNG